MNDDEQRDLVSRLFALLMMKLEDGAASAADGQGRQVSLEARTDSANRLHALGEEIATLADAILTIMPAH